MHESHFLVSLSHFPSLQFSGQFSFDESKNKGNSELFGFCRFFPEINKYLIIIM